MNGRRPRSPLIKKHGHPKSAVLRMKLVDANAAPQVIGVDPLPGKTHYLRGPDPAKWQTNVPNYAKVQYEGVYPGVDLVYYGNQQHLEYDFVVAPGADPAAIQLAVQGARTVRLDARGDLVVRRARRCALAEASYLPGDRRVRREVSGGYVVQAPASGRLSGGHIRSESAADRRFRPAYSTYLGGNGDDRGFGIAVDGAGNAYVTGWAGSWDLPHDRRGLPDRLRRRRHDGFVTEVNADGLAVFSTFLGGGDGSGNDYGYGITLDAAGNAYVTGSTGSDDFPTTAGPSRRPARRRLDAFVTKLDATGSTLVYSTFLGGGGGDSSYGIAVDAPATPTCRAAYVSIDFPTTVGRLRTTPNARQPGRLRHEVGRQRGRAGLLHVPGRQLRRGLGYGIAVDAGGRAYVTGKPPRPTSRRPPDAFQTAYAGASLTASSRNWTPSGAAWSTRPTSAGPETISRATVSPWTALATPT